MAAESTTQSPGRRERNKQDKQDRIFLAAQQLFVERGYSAVTTQEIAKAADVGAGTLFTYASSKAELLLMVMNTQVEVGTSRGKAVASSEESIVAAVMALLHPLVAISLAQPENTAVYQREILFGAPGRHRTEALNRIREFEHAIADILRRGDIRADIDAEGAARTIFSALHMEVIRMGLGAESAETLSATLRFHVDVLLRGALVPGGS
ncbi:TetR/AcrR family transcriptional regulator [Nocardia sp. NBC_01499]|uniref:TetR/AcrR family transcriptional regulator n=1 Tax=Nocardia sp. NBC_01499 TaxID=2903597 RepID=UPI003868FFF7